MPNYGYIVIIPCFLYKKTCICFVLIYSPVSLYLSFIMYMWSCLSTRWHFGQLFFSYYGCISMIPLLTKLKVNESRWFHLNPWWYAKCFKRSSLGVHTSVYILHIFLHLSLKLFWFSCRWWLMVWTSSRHGSIPRSSLMYWKMTTTTCWLVVFSSPFSLPPWSANGWQKSNCSTELGGNVADKQTPLSVSPHEAARRISQPDERQLRNIPVDEHRSRFNKAHMREQG